MKKAFVFGLVCAGLAWGLYYFFLSQSTQVDGVSQELSDDVAVQPEKVSFDFAYNPPEGWALWEGVSANMSTFVNLDGVYDPYDVVAMQEYLNTWDPTKTDVLVFIRDGDVDVQSRNYMSVVAIANTHAENPLQYDDVRMVLYDKTLDVSKEESISDIHIRKAVEVAGVTADYFRMKNRPSHDSINLSIPYKDQTITFYKNVPKDMTDQAVIDVLRPFIENIPL